MTDSTGDNPANTPSTIPTTAPAPQPAIIVIFGITGDLSKRYLMPSLYRLFRDNLVNEKTEIVGISRRDVYLDDLFNTVEMCVNEVDKVCDPVVMARMHSRTRIHQLDMDDAGAYAGLLELLNDIEAQNGLCMNRLYYLSIPPTAYQNVVKHMGQAGLNGSCPHGEAMTRLLVEKPFGNNLASAKQLIAQTAEAFGEEQIFRIDHYLAKETAQNISTFRFENPMFEAIWSKQHIESIDIVASEAIGIEGRAQFYEQQGALRDFIQNHLLQLLAIVTMDDPQQFDSTSVHAAKLKLLKSIKPITAKQVTTQTVRGQYQGYRDEVSNPKSHVETYAAIRTTIDSPRWQDVPITIRTGKAMAEKRTAITLTFKNKGNSQANMLRFRIQPDEGIELSLLAKRPGLERELQPVNMDFSYAQHFQGSQPNAYERVLTDAIRGDRTLFTNGEEILAAWEVVDAVVAAWDKSDEGLVAYQPGTAIDSLNFADEDKQ